MTEYVEYPKWVKGVVVKNADEEEAVLDGTAEFRVTKSAMGDTAEMFLPAKKSRRKEA